MMLKIYLKQSLLRFCVLSSCVLYFFPLFFFVKFLFKKCFLFSSPFNLPSAYTNQIAITPPPVKPVLSRSTMVGGDHMFLFAMRVPVRTLSWQIINNFPFTLKKLVHWTTNYMGNKSSNHWPPCLKPHWLLLCSFSICLKCFLMTSKCWHVARFQLPSPVPSVPFFFPLPSLSPHVLQLWYPQVNIASHPSLSTSTALSIL